MTQVLRYPYEALTETTDYLQLTIKKYSGANTTNILTENANFGTNKSAIDVSNTAASALKPAQLSEDGVIILPMPSNIEDSNSVSYESGEMNSIVAAGLNAVSDVTSVGSKNAAGVEGGFTQLLNNLGTKIYSGAMDTLKAGGGLAGSKDLILKALAANAVNVFGANVSVSQLLARSEGKILNPNMELLFNNVTLRTFRFSFKMTPRDEVESMQVKSIIRSLKKNMAAKKADLFLETPNIFELEYKKGNKLHPFLHRFKQCALSDMSVNYTGENVYATYSDGTPISIIMNLTFKELVPIYEDDYYDDAFTPAAGEKADTTYKDNSNGLASAMTYGVTGNQQNDVEGVGY